MSRYTCKAMTALLCLIFAVISCGQPGKVVTGVPDVPLIVGPAEPHQHRLAIRVDSVRILKDDPVGGEYTRGSIARDGRMKRIKAAEAEGDVIMDKSGSKQREAELILDRARLV